ncbi:MAG: extradiol dioxygenase [Candidatus Eremiobacter antarcticus]|nr:extradiol dioxygenase [Candidatus Eremiobacteraeota bacterium]PZR62340.1 MAG: extradiol dioxygenase [Candidatus Eremiobacter sp. RRmetagenome_bin22]
MITGIHAILFSKAAERVRAFFDDVLELKSVDGGGGRPIFAAPPAELAVHPTDEKGRHELFLTCDDIQAMVDKLKSKGIECSQPITDQGWGLLTRVKLPDGEEIGLYQPKHPTAFDR